MPYQPPPTAPAPSLYFALCLVMTSFIFAIDVFTALDIAIAVLYAVVVMVSANFLNRRGIVSVSVFCLALTLIGFVVVHGDSTRTGPVVRCFISLCAIGITTFLALRNQRATQNLRKQAALLDLSHDAIFVRDQRDLITYWNAGAERLYGWRTDEAIGRRADSLLKPKFPVLPEAIHADFQRTGRWQGELVHTKRDGTEVTVDSAWSFQSDERGRPVATMETNSDITERKDAEEKLHATRSELSHVARISTLGQLTASIAHEINQPLAAVVTNGEACLRWLLRPVPDLGEVQTSVERMISNGRRASDVVARLRALARKSEPVRDPIDITGIVEDVLPLVQRELAKHRIELKLDLAPGCGPLMGDRVQMQQLVINLLMNAVQAIERVEDHVRTLSIMVRRQPEDGSPERVVLEVRDTGCGIDPETANKLFSPFYTTKPDGMGMGLSICRSIAEAHGGRISAASIPDGGASFVVTLPLGDHPQ